MPVLVAGGGPSGSTLAFQLARSGIPVQLLTLARSVIMRHEIISPSAALVIRAAGLSAALENPSIARPCLGIRRQWAAQNIEFVDYLNQAGGQGYIVDRAAFDLFLLNLAASAGAEVVIGRLAGVMESADGISVQWQQDGRQFTSTAAVLVDATGRAGAAARRLGARKFVLDKLIAEKAPDSRRWWAGCDNWIDIRGDHRSWSYQLRSADGMTEHYDVSRASSLRRKKGWAREAVDASLAWLDRPSSTRWVAIGDAALSFDPIASQGVANAVGSAVEVAAAVSACVEHPDWRDYERKLAATRVYSVAARHEVYGQGAIANSGPR